MLRTWLRSRPPFARARRCAAQPDSGGGGESGSILSGGKALRRSVALRMPSCRNAVLVRVPARLVAVTAAGRDGCPLALAFLRGHGESALEPPTLDAVEVEIEVRLVDPVHEPAY